jgi:hypothetical protein
MRTLLTLMLLSAWPCLAQEIPPGPQQSPTQQQQQVPQAQPETASPDATITVPEGTRLQLALANPIRTRDARIGDTVRAVTTFPVTVGQDLAIPQGAYVVGSVVRVSKRGSTRFDGLQIEFKQLVFSNGYIAALDGSVIDAKAIAPVTGPSRATATPGSPATPGLMANSLQQSPPPPTPPPVPQVGPPKGPIIAASLGGMAALIVTGIIFGHRHAHDQARDFDTGFQFEIVLQAPLTLDKGRVAAALSGSSGN